jgi:CBS domain-containing protein
VSSSAAIPLAPSHRNAPVAHRDRLADFTAGPRLLIRDLMKALGRPDAADLTVAKAGSQKLTVTYPDELAEEAVAKMARLNVGRLPVVDRNNPQKFVGYLGRTGIAAAWQLLLNEEDVREPGWLTAQGRLFRMRVRRVLGRFGSGD